MADEQRRFWAKVSVGGPDECWLWLASTRGIEGKKYGQFRVKRGGLSFGQGAHILAWEYEHGPVPGGMFVCHKCDVKLCVNVSHLFLGTALDNNRDMMNKRRHKYGADHWNAKLTAEDVDLVRELAGLGETQRGIANRLNVGQPAISRILSGDRRRLA